MDKKTSTASYTTWPSELEETFGVSFLWLSIKIPTPWKTANGMRNTSLWLTMMSDYMDGGNYPVCSRLQRGHINVDSKTSNLHRMVNTALTKLFARLVEFPVSSYMHYWGLKIIRYPTSLIPFFYIIFALFLSSYVCCYVWMYHFWRQITGEEEKTSVTRSVIGSFCCVITRHSF
jgi:hypothetical protein